MATPNPARPDVSQTPEPTGEQKLGEHPAPNLNLSANAQSITPQREVTDQEFATVATTVLQEKQPNERPSEPRGKAKRRGWQQLGLRSKTTLAALLIGTAPVLALGGLAYNLSAKSLEETVSKAGITRAKGMADQTNSFMFERYGDIQILAKLPVFTNPSVRESLTLEQKQNLLENYRQTYGVYSSIAAFDLNGNVIAQSTAGAALGNHADRDYFQAVVRSGKPHIAEPTKSKTTGETAMYFAAPILDETTGKMIGVIRSRMSMEALAPLMTTFSANAEEPHIANKSGEFIAALEQEQVGNQLTEDFAKLAPLLQDKQNGSVIDIDKIDNVEQLVAYAPFPSYEGLPDLGWSAVIAVDAEIVFASQRQLLTALLLGTAGVAVLVTLVSIYLATQATRPVIQAAEVVERIGRGDLEARLALPEAGDELVQLGQNINQMGNQLQTFFAQQSSEARMAQVLGELARVRDEGELPMLLDQVMHEVQRQVGGDRVLFQQAGNPSGKKTNNTIVAEALMSGLPKLQGQASRTLSPEEIETYTNQSTLVLSNIQTGDLSPEQRQQLQSWRVQSIMATPILINNELYGLLEVHSCNQERQWKTQDSEFFTQIGLRLGLALGGFESFKQAQIRGEEERQQKETLQRELMGFLSSVEGASGGDLTVRAQITAGEIGIVADFFNAIVENLREVVTEVKQAAEQVNTSVSSSGTSIGKLATDSLNQSHQVKETLVSVELMTTALQKVAAQAKEATRTTQQAEITAQAGGKAMEKTVDSIQQVRETVAETAKKVKRLGESSQQISKVVELINQISLKTNLLAVNAGIEAARAGEEGRGFAVVAEEVGALAAQSAIATKEIEQIISSIQTGTTEVVEAMESSTAQVVEGTRSVEEAKQSLAQILLASQQVNEVFQMISKETVEQADTSGLVQQLMMQMAKVSEAASKDSDGVSKLLAETVAVAQKLQTSVSTFKVDLA